jgi:hypothetical protein
MRLQRNHGPGRGINDSCLFQSQDMDESLLNSHVIRTGYLGKLGIDKSLIPQTNYVHHSKSQESNLRGQ